MMHAHPTLETLGHPYTPLEEAIFSGNISTEADANIPQLTTDKWPGSKAIAPNIARRIDAPVDEIRWRMHNGNKRIHAVRYA